jgi:hypothetical protein
MKYILLLLNFLFLSPDLILQFKIMMGEQNPDYPFSFLSYVPILVLFPVFVFITPILLFTIKKKPYLIVYIIVNSLLLLLYLGLLSRMDYNTAYYTRLILAISNAIVILMSLRL